MAKDNYKWLQNTKIISNRTLISDARGYRRGTEYYGGEAYKNAVEREILRRKKLGIMNKRVGGVTPLKKKLLLDFNDLNFGF